MGLLVSRVLLHGGHGKRLCPRLVRGRCGEVGAYRIAAQFLAMDGRVNAIQAGRIFAQDFPLGFQGQLTPYSWRISSGSSKAINFSICHLGVQMA